MAILSTLLLLHGLAGSAASEDAILEANVVDSDAGGSNGTLLKLGAGFKHGVELHDHGELLDQGAVATRFAIIKVTPKTSFAWVPLTPAEAEGLKDVRIMLTPGKDPARLDRLELGARGLGSCATGYEMYKSGVINTWTESATGKVTELWISNLGWKHRVCEDSTGMIYVGDATDAFVADEGRNIRLQVARLGYRTTKVVVLQGRLTADMLKGNRRVVFRAKK